MLSSGETTGLFQLESSGVRSALKQMKPNQFEDIVALVALYRPGPMNNIPIYNDCKNGIKKPDYIHKSLENILKPTYGIIIYQEQVMHIAQTLAGFTAGDADILRKAMGKKKRKELEKQEEKFFDSCIVGPKAPQGCFSSKSVFLCKFPKIHVDLHSKMLQLRNQKVVPAVTVDEKKNTGCIPFEPPWNGVSNRDSDIKCSIF